ncbi:hypothetical protein BSKO_01830 [Bryopsis sp. KO-2023]|nr:hypothetical protein BSKO_01830 [Bryopsis sp. KO-2023]
MSRRRALGKRIGTLLQDEILDEAEQDELVQSFEEMQRSQERIWRVVLGGLSLLLSSVLFLDGLQQWGEPWGRKHHALWEAHVSLFWIVAFEIAQGLALCCCGLEFLLHRQHGVRIRPVFVGMGGSLVVGTCMILKLAQTLEFSAWLKIDLLWLPVLPFVFCCTMLVPLKSFQVSKREVVELRKKMYGFKKL